MISHVRIPLDVAFSLQSGLQSLHLIYVSWALTLASRSFSDTDVPLSIVGHFVRSNYRDFEAIWALVDAKRSKIWKLQPCFATSFDGTDSCVLLFNSIHDAAVS